jgi:hypothetical protein
MSAAHAAPGERVGRWQLLSRDQLRDDRPPGRRIDRRERRLHHNACKQHTNLVELKHGLDEQDDAHQHRPGRSDQHQLAAIDRIGDRAAESPKTTTGAKLASPSRPTSSDKQVIACACGATATRVTCVPMNDTV